MKKLLLLAIAFLPVGIVTAGTITTKTYAKSSSGCSGNGICTVTTTSSNMQEHVTTTWTFEPEQRLLTMLISSEHFKEIPSYLQNILDDGQFIMDSPFAFPQDISTELGSDGVLTIPAGSYPVNRTGSGYQVNFSIR